MVSFAHEKEEFIYDSKIENGYSSITSNGNGNASKTRRGSLRSSIIDTARANFAATKAGLSARYEKFDESNSALYLCILIMVIYTILGAVGFSFSDEWSIIDAMYFVVVTFTTCGYGDFYPQNDTERIYTCFFVLFGVAVLGGYSLTIISERLMETVSSTTKKQNKSCNDDFIGKFKMESEIYLKSISVRGFETMPTLGTGSSVANDMKEALKDTAPFLLLVFASAIYMGYVEGWSIITSIYFCVITGTTVGYGDVAPETESMRIFAIFFIPLSVGTLAITFGRLTSVVISHKAASVEKEFLKRKMTETDFKRMDVDGDEHVTYEEFITFMLVSMGKVEHEDMIQLNVIYHQLSAGKGGILLDDLRRKRDASI